MKEEMDIAPINLQKKVIAKNKYEILNKDPLKPNLITITGNNTYKINTHTFQYFKAIIKGRESPFRLTIIKKEGNSNVMIKGFASTKSIQPNKFNSEIQFDGRAFTVHTNNKSKLFSD